MDTINTFIIRSLTTNIPPILYILMGVSVFIGFCFGTGLLVGSSESILYTAGVLVHKQAWGIVLFCTSTLAEIGFIKDNDALIKLGGTTGFMAWLFACIALAMLSHWYILITVGLLHLLFHGYVVLATSLGYIRHNTRR